jgi:hypothetical protein
MIKSESMTLLFSVLSKIMPILAPRLKHIRERKGMDLKNVKVWNAAKRRKGVQSAYTVLIDCEVRPLNNEALILQRCSKNGP